MSEYSYKGGTGEPSRRFIAAARCPSCHREDTLYFIAEIGGDHACIECGYDSSKPASLATDATTLKIIDAPVKQQQRTAEDTTDRVGRVDENNGGSKDGGKDSSEEGKHQEINHREDKQIGD